MLENFGRPAGAQRNITLAKLPYYYLLTLQGSHYVRTVPSTPLPTYLLREEHARVERRRRGRLLQRPRAGHLGRELHRLLR